MSVNPWIDKMISTGKKTAWGGFFWGASDVSCGSVTIAEGQMLYDVVRDLKPRTILEVGTSFGFSTIHLAQACKDNGWGMVYTVENAPERSEVAKENFASAGLSEIIIQHDQIPVVPTFDFAFLDAGHTTQAVREYLQFVGLARIVYIHDPKYDNHVSEAIVGSEWRLQIIDTDSMSGMGILTR